MNLRFESFVNSEEYQTGEYAGRYDFGLRALLIQKSIKPKEGVTADQFGLRALLIQKSIKR